MKWNPCRWLGERRAELERLAPGYGNKILLQLFLTYGLYCKSLAYDLVSDSWIPVQTYINGLAASDANDLFVVVRSPLAMKTIWAVLSDVFPINGYRKRYMIVIAAGLSNIGLLVVVLTNRADRMDGEVSNISNDSDLVTTIADRTIKGGAIGTSSPQIPIAALIVTFCFFIFMVGNTIVDSMTQARYTELMKGTGNASLVTFVWFLMNCSGFFAAFNLLLPTDEKASAEEHVILLWIAVTLSFPMIVPAAMNWLAEEQGDPSCRPNFAAVRKNLSIFVLSCVTAIVSLGGVVVQLTTGSVVWFGIEARWYNGVFYAIGSVIVMVACCICLPKTISVPAIYVFLSKAFQLNIGFILQYWYIAPDECMTKAVQPFPLGPRFTNSYYQMVSGYGGTLASLVAVVIFDRTIQFWNVRAAFCATTFVNCLATIFELMILERWNQRLFGIDLANPDPWVDQAFFIVGAKGIERLLETLEGLPVTVLIGKLCPKNVEAQVFAILACLANFGGSVAYINGSIIAQVLEVKFEKDSGTDTWHCSNPMDSWGFMSMVGWLKMVATFFLPLAVIPFALCLLPNIKLSDDMLGESVPVSDGLQIQLRQQEGYLQNASCGQQQQRLHNIGDSILSSPALSWA
jgi:hypothetical protein